MIRHRTMANNRCRHLRLFLLGRVHKYINNAQHHFSTPLIPQSDQTVHCHSPALRSKERTELRGATICEGRTSAVPVPTASVGNEYSCSPDPNLLHGASQS